MAAILITNANLAEVLPAAASLHAAFVVDLDRELAAAAKLLLELETELPSLQADLEAAASLTAQIQANIIDPFATIQASLEYMVSGQAALALNLATPAFLAELAIQLAVNVKATAELNAKVSVKAAALADVNLRIGLLRASLDLAKSFGEDLKASARVYYFNGPLSELGVVDGAGLPLNTPVKGAIVVTEKDAAFESMKRLFKLVA